MAKLTNPYTGSPRDIRDVDSDPEGVLIHQSGAPIKAMTARWEELRTAEEVVAAMEIGRHVEIGFRDVRSPAVFWNSPAFRNHEAVSYQINYNDAKYRALIEEDK